MSEPVDDSRTMTQWIGMFCGPLLGWIIAYHFVTWPTANPELANSPLSNSQLPAMAFVTIWMAIWWITEAVPIAATALLPLVLFPLLGILPAQNVANAYGHRLIFLFLGGFLIAIAIEESGLHKRVALTILSWVGDQPRRIVAGFMFATALLSMWLSNTATTLMLLPIAGSVLSQLDESSKPSKQQVYFGIALMLGIAYSASIGGFATLIGTPPNVAFNAIFSDTFPKEPEIGFANWMLLGVPLSASMLIVCWFLLTFVLYPLGSESFLGGGNAIALAKEELGPMQHGEWLMLGVFCMTAFLWVFREPIDGFGWAPMLDVATMEFHGKSVGLVDDGTVAMLMAIICFMLPSGKVLADGETSREPLLTWKATQRLPWGILLLFGGGLALAAGMKETKLDFVLGTQLADALGGLSPLMMALATATGMTFLTELTSNLASVQMLLPVLAKASVALGVDPRVLMIPATIAASCAFMLPVATPPNAIVYGSGRLKMMDMVKAGFVMNLVGIVLIVLFVTLIHV